MAHNTILPGTGEVYAAHERGDGVKEQIIQMKFADSPAVDPFGRLRVSTLTTLFDSKFITGDKQPLFWDEALQSGSGITSSTPTADKPYIDLLSTANTAGVFTRQTYQRFNYQPGKSNLIMLTDVLRLAGGGTGAQKLSGYFDDNNGLFFSDDEVGVSVNIRSNDTSTPVDTSVAQTAWNLDRMDGAKDSTNPSGITIDWTKAQILVLDFQWLGVGVVRFGLQINGAIYYVHNHSVANTGTVPWSSTPNLPVRHQLITTAASPASSMRLICSTILMEGVREENGIVQSDGSSAAINANTLGTFYAVMGGRLKSNCFGTTLRPLGVSLVALTTDAFEWQIRFNPTVAGTFTYADKANSCMQIAPGAVDGSNTVTGGVTILRGFGASGSAAGAEIHSNLSLGSSIAGVATQFVLCVRPLSANLDIEGSANWKEVT